MEKQKEIYKKVKQLKKNEDQQKKKALDEDSQYILKTLPSSLKLQNKLQQINEETSEEMMSQIKINESCKNSIQYLNSEQGGVKIDHESLIQERVIDQSINYQSEQVLNLVAETPYQDEKFSQFQPLNSTRLKTVQVKDRQQKMDSEDQETANYNEGEEMDVFNQKYQTIDKSQKSKSKKRESSSILEIQRKSELIENKNSQIKNIVEQSLASMQKVEGLFKRVEEDLQSPQMLKNSIQVTINSDNSSENDDYIKNLINQKKEIQKKMIQSQQAFNKKNSQDSQFQDKKQNFDEVFAYGILQKQESNHAMVDENLIKDNSQMQLKVQKKKKKKKVAKKFIQENNNYNDKIEDEKSKNTFEKIQQNDQNYSKKDLSSDNQEKNQTQKQDQDISINDIQNKKMQKENKDTSKPISNTINRSNTVSLQKLSTPKKLELSKILIDSKKQIDKGENLIQKSLRDQQNRHFSNKKSKDILEKNQDINNSYVFPQILNKSTSSLKTFKNFNAQKYDAKQYNETSQYYNNLISKQKKFSGIDNSINQSNQSLDFKNLYKQNQTQKEYYNNYYNRSSDKNSINHYDQSSIGNTGRQSQNLQNLEESFNQKNSYQDQRQPRFHHQSKRLRYPEPIDEINNSNYTDEAQQISPNTKQQQKQKQSESILKSKILIKEQNSLNNSMQVEDTHMNISEFDQNRFNQIHEKRASTQIEKHTPSFAKNSFVNIQQMNMDKNKINDKINKERSIFATDKKKKDNYIMPHQLSDSKKSRDSKSLNFYLDSKNNQSSLGSYYIQKEESSNDIEQKVDRENQWNFQNQQLLAMHQSQNKTLNNFKKKLSENSLSSNMLRRQSQKLKDQIVNNTKENSQIYIENEEIDQQGGIKKLIKPKQVTSSQKAANGLFNKTGFEMKGKINVVKKINLAKVGNLIQDQLNESNIIDQL